MTFFRLSIQDKVFSFITVYAFRRFLAFEAAKNARVTSLVSLIVASIALAVLCIIDNKMLILLTLIALSTLIIAYITTCYLVRAQITGLPFLKIFWSALTYFCFGIQLKVLYLVAFTALRAIHCTF